MKTDGMIHAVVKANVVQVAILWDLFGDSRKKTVIVQHFERYRVRR